MKTFLAFIGGAGLGVLGSAIFCRLRYKKQYDAKLEEEIQKIRDFYAEDAEKQRQEIVRETRKGLNEYKETVNQYDNITLSSSKGPAIDIRENSSANDYTQYSHKDEDESRNEDLGEIATQERAEEYKKPPKLIKASEFGDNPAYSALYIYYYTENGVLTLADDYDKETVTSFEEAKEYIGDALTKYNFIDEDNDEEVIYVRNYRLSTDYCITKVFAKYTE